MEESLAVSKSRDVLRNSRFQPPFLCRFNVGCTWCVRREDGEEGMHLQSQQQLRD